MATAIVNGIVIDSDSRLEFVANPKRPNFNAHRRYDIYQDATTIDEYLDLAEAKYAKADLRYDVDKHYLFIFDAEGVCQNPTEKMLAETEAEEREEELVATETETESEEFNEEDAVDTKMEEATAEAI